MPKFLSRDEIFSAEDIRYEIVEVPEWGGAIKLRSLSGAERDDFEAKSMVGHGNKQRINTRRIRARLIAMCAIDENNHQLFEPADVMKLSEKSAAALERLFEAAQRLSGMTDDDLRELEQGFDGARSEPSISA